MISINSYDQYAQAWDCGVDVPVGSDSVRFFHTKGKDSVERVFVDHPSFLAKVWGKTGAKLYGSAAGSDYADNQARFALFCRAALAAIDALPFVPGGNESSKLTIVANDWHSALVPVLVKDVEKPAGRFKNAKVALCIHNAAFQGRFHAESFGEQFLFFVVLQVGERERREREGKGKSGGEKKLSLSKPQKTFLNFKLKKKGVLGLPAASKSRFEFEDGQPREFIESEDPDSLPAVAGKFAKINWLKAGALAADAVLTVSPNYARDICSGPSGGVELDDVFRSVGVEGIVNGRNTPAPATAAGGAAASSLLPLEFDASTVAEGKAVAKETLQAELGLPVDPDAALFGFVGRLEEQKGVDVLLEAIPGLVKRAGGKKVQVAVLGTGKKNLEAQVASLGDKFPGVASGTVAFSAPLAALITAGSDFFVVCSRQEPCGLVQLDAMARGTVPVVATVGGLVDTVKEGATGYHVGKINPDGLVAEDVEALAATLARAAAAHGTPQHDAMRDRCISQDLSWAKPAAKWEAVLEDLSRGSATAETGAKKAAVTTPVAAV